MVAMLCGMMEFELLLEWVMTEPDLIKALADAWLERTAEKVNFLLDQKVGPFWHFNGVERASPPMMGPRQWAEWVVPYDGRIMRLIKERDPESIIHAHCHGRVGTLLDSFMAMGVDSTDPVEPPPQGDIEFAEAKRRVAGRMTLYGNMEFLYMETCDPDVVEEKVRSAIEDGGKAHTVLFPSAVPHERHTAKFMANAVRYIEAGLKYGTL
jgi:uroporphyrinogen-III decarboxylase